MSRGLFEATEEFSAKLFELMNLPLYDQSERMVTSDVACSLSLEHWNATITLLQRALLPSAVVLHRAQFEALLRSIWLLYIATDHQIGKLLPELNLETEQTAKNLPQVAQMMAALEKKGPQHAYAALARFKETSWKALNSYAHAGIHPLRRHAEGYPKSLIEDIARNANGLSVVAAMQAAALSGAHWQQRPILDLAAQYPECMPPLL